jgi:hypothetical protein
LGNFLFGHCLIRLDIISSTFITKNLGIDQY